MARPVILLDVDGPLNPYAAPTTKRPEGYETHFMTPTSWAYVKPLKVLLNPLHGPALLSLDCELIWATAWEDDANEWIGPHIGLPKLPVINWLSMDYGNPEKLHWKTKRIAEWMNENRPNSPFMWVDDENTSRDMDFFRDHCLSAPAIMTINPREGLTSKHFGALEHWLGTLCP